MGNLFGTQRKQERKVGWSPVIHTLKYRKRVGVGDGLSCFRFAEVVVAAPFKFTLNSVRRFKIYIDMYQGNPYRCLLT